MVPSTGPGVGQLIAAGFASVDTVRLVPADRFDAFHAK